VDGQIDERTFRVVTNTVAIDQHHVLLIVVVLDDATDDALVLKKIITLKDLPSSGSAVATPVSAASISTT